MCDMVKAELHVPGQKGKSKCYKMHIGDNKGTCPVLKVHGTVMEKVTEDKLPWRYY